MSTSAETHFVDERGTCAILWRATDGHPAAHGAELKELLSTFELVDHLPARPESDLIGVVPRANEPRIANGMPCLAAQVVAFFKGDEPGDFYLQPPNYFELPPGFRYTVYLKAGVLSLRCEVPESDRTIDDPPLPGELVHYTWREIYDGPASLSETPVQRW